MFAIDSAQPFTLGRRGFLGTAGALVLAVTLEPGAALAQGGTSLQVGGADASPSLFISLEPDGTVRITCHRSEMGQQVWTSMAQLVADELDVPWDKVEIVQAEGHPRYGDQNTDGSRSVRYNFTRLRTAGAALRTLLEQAAAKRWKVPVANCHAELGKVSTKDGKQSLPYAELAKEAAELPLPPLNRIKLKPREKWRYIQKNTASLTNPKIVRGEGTFGQDVQLPGMLYAVVARPPRVFDTLKRFNATNAEAVRGVISTLELPKLKAPAGFKPLGGVAVVAKDTWSAIRGREELEVEWDTGPNADYATEAFAKELVETCRKPGEVRRKRGDVAKALSEASQRVQAEYTVAHLAHVAMEPPAATARWDGDKVTCWACVQSPQSARKTVAELCKVPEDSVTIHPTWLGGGFGRKSKPDFVAEAALIARQAKAPVKLIWTREDDLQHAYYHTVSAQRFEAGLDEKGKCVAWLHRTTAPTIASTFVKGATRPRDGDMRLGATDNPFDVPALQLESGKAPAHLRIGWLRSVGNIYHAFGVQSFAAELAHAAKRDQLEYLLELIGPPRTFDPNQEGAKYDNYGSPMKSYPIDTGRLAAVTKRAGELCKWGRELPPGHGLGVASHRSFVTYAATAVEVKVTPEGALTLVGVWAVMDAGTVVNPDNAASQLEGGTLFGLSNALYGAVTARKGIVQQKNFPDYRLMRMNEAPRQMQVEVIESDAPPGGVGEPPTPPAAPALANAIFNACGLRVRKLPIFGADRTDRLPVAANTAAKSAAPKGAQP